MALVMWFYRVLKSDNEWVVFRIFNPVISFIWEISQLIESYFRLIDADNWAVDLAVDVNRV